MTDGFGSTMRPIHCRTVLHVSILAVLLLTLNVDTGEDSGCSTDITVRYDTSYEALLGQELRINCTVSFCMDSPSTVSWYKVEETFVPVNVSSNSHIKAEWRQLNETEGILFLIFQNILRSDSGLYQCQSRDGVSHRIKVSVSGDGETTNATQKPGTNVTVSNPEPTDNLWMYVYSAAGIATFVIVVIIISVISMRGCKGKSKTETQTENQYMAIPIVEQPIPHASLQASPRGSPSVPPTRRSIQRQTPSLSRGNEPLYSQTKKDGERQRKPAEEEGGSVVYAALNHQLPPRAAARPRRPVEESSEYAAIRVG